MSRAPDDHAAADPHRALGLTVRSTRQLAVISLGIGLVVAIGPGLMNPLRFKWYILGAAVVMLIAPGMAYALALRPLRNKRMGALVAVQIAAGVQCLGALLLVIAQLRLRPISPVPLVLAVVAAVALLQLLRQVHQARSAIRYDRADAVRGFEVMPVQPAPAPAPRDAGPDVPPPPHA